MTVKQLMDQLSTFNPDAIVAMSIDPEGNRFHPLDELEGNGEIHTPTEADPLNYTPVVTLWPGGAEMEIEDNEGDPE